MYGVPVAIFAVIFSFTKAECIHPCTPSQRSFIVVANTLKLNLEVESVDEVKVSAPVIERERIIHTLYLSMYLSVLSEEVSTHPVCSLLIIALTLLRKFGPFKMELNETLIPHTHAHTYTHTHLSIRQDWISLFRRLVLVDWVLRRQGDGATVCLPSLNPLYACPASTHCMSAQSQPTVCLPSLNPLYVCLASTHCMPVQPQPTVCLPSLNQLYVCPASTNCMSAQSQPTVCLLSLNPLYACPASTHCMSAQPQPTVCLPSLNQLYVCPVSTHCMSA